MIAGGLRWFLQYDGDTLRGYEMNYDKGYDGGGGGLRLGDFMEGYDRGLGMGEGVGGLR
jgi:hypothetical protein